MIEFKKEEETAKARGDKVLKIINETLNEEEKVKMILLFVHISGQYPQELQRTAANNAAKLLLDLKILTFDEIINLAQKIVELMKKIEGEQN